MLRVSDLRHKDIINITDGRRLGFVRDVDVDVQSGQINAVVVPGEASFFSLFAREEDMVIPWRQIKRIGVDVILAELSLR
ncbi:MAG: YlmC/YmxH family sporulation protein [Oscillospiraceae bacterium]|nr:YlmC/YmxH family sporulation protein [Oscillospiraceae bacterium]